MSHRRRVRAWVCGVLAAVLLLGGVGWTAWRMHAQSALRERAYRTSGRLIAEKRYREALAVINTFHPPYRWEAGAQDSVSTRWIGLEIEALAGLGRLPRLYWLYEQLPALFLNREQASLLVARTLLQMRDHRTLETLRGIWRGREMDRTAWLVVDADVALQQGRRDDALTLLEKTPVSGREASPLKIRLALLHRDDPVKAWQYLEEAYRADPENGEVRSFRGQLLEAGGLLREAEAEYRAAREAAPDVALFQDQLGEFYRRRAKYALAVETWVQGLEQTSLPFFALKAWFWSHVTTPARVDWAAREYVEDRLRPLLTYLLALPADRFWDEGEFQKVPGGHQLERERQEIFWLRLLQVLKAGDEAEALALLEVNAFRDRSWHADLEQALWAVLKYRQDGRFSVPSAAVRVSRSRPPAAGDPPAGGHRFFDTLRMLASRRATEHEVPLPVRRLLQSTHAVAAVFLAGGWLEAALGLQAGRLLPADLPDWVAFGYAQAVRYNQGPVPALAFIDRQPATPALRLLQGELLLGRGRVAEAERLLEPLQRDTSAVGYRAAWLLSLAFLDQGDVDRAGRSVRDHPALARSVTGQEVLAKVALAKGDSTAALRLYRTIEESSLEAKAFLARVAYGRRDWQQAESLTRRMLAEHPENPQLRANLRAIAAAAGGRE